MHQVIVKNYIFLIGNIEPIVVVQFLFFKVTHSWKPFEYVIAEEFRSR